MKTLSRIKNVILIVLFPLGISYCIFHTLGKDFATFLGGVFLLGTGVLLGIYIVEPQLVLSWWNTAINWLSFLKK